MRYIGDADATIAAEGQLSNAVDIREAKFISFIFPTLDDCNITFKVALTKTGSYVDLKNTVGNLVTIGVSTGACAIEFEESLAGFGWIKLYATETQNDERVISVILRS